MLTHDPGMYPKRLILDDARQFGIAVLPLDVNASEDRYRVERVDPQTEDETPGVDTLRWSLVPVLGELPRGPGRATASGWRWPRSRASPRPRWPGSWPARPYASLADFWQRARVSRPVVERLVLAGAFDALYGIGVTGDLRRRGRVTRRDLLLQVAELDRPARALERAARGRGSGRAGVDGTPADPDPSGRPRSIDAAAATLSVRERHALAAQGPGRPASRRRRRS